MNALQSHYRNPRGTGTVVTGLLAAITLTGQAFAADLLVELDSPRIKAGESITIHLVALNPTSTPARQSFPASVPATLNR